MGRTVRGSCSLLMTALAPLVPTGIWIGRLWTTAGTAGYAVSAKIGKRRLLHRASKGGGGRLAKQRFVFHREPAELPEPVAGGELGDGGAAGAALAQRSAQQVHPAEQQVVLWPHAQMLLAARQERALRCADRAAQLRDVDRLARRTLDDVMKPPHDRRVLPRCRPVLIQVSGDEAIDHRSDHRLLEAA